MITRREADFEAEFSPQSEEIIVYIENHSEQGYTADGYREMHQKFTAVWNLKRNQPEAGFGELHWIEKETPFRHKFRLNAGNAWRLRIRKSTIVSHRYLVCTAKKAAADYRSGLKKEAEKPVTLQTTCGEFILNKDLLFFAGTLENSGESRNIYLETDHGDLNAEVLLKRLNEIVSQLKNWDEEVKAFAAEDLLDLARDWNAEEDEIGRTEFIRRIGTPDITIHPDRTVTFTFDSDGMFTDHAIEIGVDQNDEITGSDIVG